MTECGRSDSLKLEVILIGRQRHALYPCMRCLCTLERPSPSCMTPGWLIPSRWSLSMLKVSVLLHHFWRLNAAGQINAQQLWPTDVMNHRCHKVDGNLCQGCKCVNHKHWAKDSSELTQAQQTDRHACLIKRHLIRQSCRSHSCPLVAVCNTDLLFSKVDLWSSAAWGPSEKPDESNTPWLQLQQV